MRPKVILSVLVCLAFLLSLGVAVKDAKADALMFPWVTKSDSVSTIISVVNTAGAPFGGVYQISGIPITLHYQYIYKNTTDYDPAKASTWLLTTCLENDFSRPTSMNDIVTFDASGKINGGKPMFDDTATGIDASLYADARFDIGDGVPGPRRAYLLVDNNNNFLHGVDNTLYGEAIVMEVNGGGAWGYIAYNASGGTGETQAVPLDFSDGNDLLGEVLNNMNTGSFGPIALEYAPVVLLNPNDAKTRFYVTPIDAGFNNTGSGGCSNDTSGPDQRKRNINTAFQFNTITQPDYRFVGGIYDNNEQPLSFTTPIQVVCTAAINLDLIIDAGVYVPWKNSGHQAWTYVSTLKGTVNQSPNDDCIDNGEMQAVIGKLEYTEAASAFQGQNVAGAVNNFIWLRNSGSIEGPGGVNMIMPIPIIDGI